MPSTLFDRPMALWYLCIITLGQSTQYADSQQMHQNKTISEVENPTGFHSWNTSGFGIAEGLSSFMSVVPSRWRASES
jgi:hypothetical protein